MEKLYTITEASELLVMHRNTVSNMIKDGRINANQIGSKYVITESEIMRLRGEDEDRKFSLKMKEIVGANIIQVQVGSDNVSVGDGALTQFSIEDKASTNWSVCIDGEVHDDVKRLSVMLKGSSERNTFVEALEFIIRQIKTRQERDDVLNLSGN